MKFRLLAVAGLVGCGGVDRPGDGIIFPEPPFWYACEVQVSCPARQPRTVARTVCARNLDEAAQASSTSCETGCGCAAACVTEHEEC